jgi:LysM repeat protein
VLYVHLPVSPAAVADTRAVSASGKAKRSSYLATASAPVSKPGGDKPSTNRRHTVRRGETLYSIANTYRTSVAAIKRTNENIATLRPGMVLVIPPRQ